MAEADHGVALPIVSGSFMSQQEVRNDGKEEEAEWKKLNMAGR